MIRNYIKIAWRNLSGNRVYSLVNIAGLGIGLAAFWLIALYIANELSYDRYHKDADRIYRLVSHARWDGGSFNITGTSSAFAPALKNDYPEIKQIVRIDPEGGGILSYGDKHFKEDGICFADKTMFGVFTFHFLYGDANTALAKPQCIVLTKTLAVKLFGNAESALNKTVTFENNYPNLVTGVIDDVPLNSHFLFSAVRSYPPDFNEGWTAFHLITYFKLAPGTSGKQLEAKLPQFVTKHLKAELATLHMKNLDYHLEVQPITAIHLHSSVQAEIGENGSITYVYIFSIIGLLILVIASINYMNLSTAYASLRVKEIGVRKVNGSTQGQLISMFLVEAVLLTFIAAVAAIGIIYCVAPWYNQLTGKQLNIWYLGVPGTLGILVLFSVFTGLLSGIYPALFLANFKLIPALKGQAGSRQGNVVFRKALVAFQFVVTICMISGSLIIYQQLGYVMKTDMGFNKDQVLTFHLQSKAVRAKLPQLKAQLSQSPLIASVGGAGIPIGHNLVNLGVYNPEINGVIAPQSHVDNYLYIDEDFIQTLQLKLLQGRNYSKTMATDKDQPIIVNETLVKDAGWKDPLGKRIQIGVGGITYRVIGVVKDFHFFSLQHKIEPLLLALITDKNEDDNVYVRLSKNNIPAAISYIERVYRQFDSDAPLSYTFLDKNFADLYDTERRQGNILLTFTILAISIACLGLFGLAAFMVGQRVKEIGIRKVLGASVNSIVQLISKDFVKLVLIAAIIAIPLAWFAMDKWLQSFAYRITIQWWVFVSAGMVTVVIAVVTVSFQSIKAALANPVKSLRSE